MLVKLFNDHSLKTQTPTTAGLWFFLWLNWLQEAELDLQLQSCLTGRAADLWTTSSPRCLQLPHRLSAAQGLSLHTMLKEIDEEKVWTTTATARPGEVR